MQFIIQLLKLHHRVNRQEIAQLRSRGYNYKGYISMDNLVNVR